MVIRSGQLSGSRRGAIELIVALVVTGCSANSEANKVPPSLGKIPEVLLGEIGYEAQPDAGSAPLLAIEPDAVTMKRGIKIMGRVVPMKSGEQVEWPLIIELWQDGSMLSSTLGRSSSAEETGDFHAWANCYNFREGEAELRVNTRNGSTLATAQISLNR